jgi:hypothetical protein
VIHRQLRRNPWLVVVLLAGLAIRAVAIPIGHGQDFVVWDEASATTLRGVNIYAHHPNYPGGPFAYFPLFLYIELPFQWLAQHTGLPFTVLGKLPILCADVACVLLIAAELRRRRCAPKVIASGAACFFLNPLVLYNSAYYGRFDSVGAALLLLALRGAVTERVLTWRTSIWFALAAAAKTFPGFVLPGVLRSARGARRRVVVGLVAVFVVLCLPYLATLPALVHDIVLYNVAKPPTGLSWQHVLLHAMSARSAKAVGWLLLVVFLVGTVWLTRVRDLYSYTALTLVLFVLCSKLVLEQYLIWPMPWLVLIGLTRTSRFGRAGLTVALAFTVVGLLENESVHPFGRPADLLNVLIAVVAAAYLVIGIVDERAGRRTAALSGGEHDDDASGRQIRAREQAEAAAASRD